MRPFNESFIYVWRRMRNQYLCLLIASLLLIVSCKKESPILNDEEPRGVFSVISSGTTCANSTVIGNYGVGVPMDASDKVTIQVNVTNTGTYTVTSATVYGMKFSDSGRFVNTGIQTITLKASGTPGYAGDIFVYFTAGASACSFIIPVSPAIPPPISSDNDHMLFGNPGHAATVTDSVNNYLMRKAYYALSYSRDRGIPNWVSWHLYAPDLGSTPRQDDFRPDDALPAGWYQVPANAYSGSGFDRGHNTPSADRTSSGDANSATFLMTNMIPQAPYLNQQTWARLEDSLRRLVNAGFELYIIMGTYGSGGTGSNGFATTIHGGRVTVPGSVWKIAVVIPNGNNDSSRVNNSIRMIAVDIPNTNSVNSNWKNYRVSVDAIESATGYDLLELIPASLQMVLEAKVDNI
jgi:DNA/RNA endonuclease G (NUC1)